MQNDRTTVMSLLCACLSSGALFAQRGPVAAGGEGSGTGGTVSYSIGLVDYITVLNPNAHITQGLQQPYEVFQYAGIEEQMISLFIYPNPATGTAWIVAGNSPYEDLRFELSDEAGRVLSEGPLTAGETAVELTGLATASYFVRISHGTESLKTYKIIKH